MAARVWTEPQFEALRSSLVRPTVHISEIKTGAADTAVLSLKDAAGGESVIKMYKCVDAQAGVPQSMLSDKVGVVVAHCHAVKELPRHVHAALDAGATAMLWGSMGAVNAAVLNLKNTFSEKTYRPMDYYIRPAHTDTISRMTKMFYMDKYYVCLVGDPASFAKPVCLVALSKGTQIIQ